jgi:hypothetical protein
MSSTPGPTPGAPAVATAEQRELAELRRRVAGMGRPARRLVNAPRLLVAVILAIWVACSMAYAVLEDKGPIESLWWGVVTGSTVGYGDFYPSSTAGRGVAVVLIVSMLILVPIAIGHVIASLVLDRNQFTHTEQVALAEAIASVHDRVDKVEFLLLESLGEQHGAQWVQQKVAAFDAADCSAAGADDRMLELFRRTADS